MKVGDLVQMKFAMFWTLKSNPRISYTEESGIVVKTGSHIMEVMWPTGKIDKRDKDLFAVIK